MLEDDRSQSTIVQLLTGISDRLGTALERSRTAAFGRTCRRYVQSSWCYRWLTTEPDPDVIVIDLRETKTVGPIIAVMERLGAAFQRAMPSSKAVDETATVAAAGRSRPLAVSSLVVLAATVGSFAVLARSGSLTTWPILAHLGIAGLAALGVRSRHDFEYVREAKTIQLVTTAFEPPEPPDASTQSATQQSATRADTNRNPAEQSQASTRDSLADSQVGDDSSETRDE